MTDQDRQAAAEAFKRAADRLTAATVVAIKAPSDERWAAAAVHLDEMTEIVSRQRELERAESSVGPLGATAQGWTCCQCGGPTPSPREDPDWECPCGLSFNPGTGMVERHDAGSD